jgi:hypothetical protein
LVLKTGTILKALPINWKRVPATGHSRNPGEVPALENIDEKT